MQLIYGYVETDADTDADMIQTRLSPQGQEFFYIPHYIRKCMPPINHLVRHARKYSGPILPLTRRRTIDDGIKKYKIAKNL